MRHAAQKGMWSIMDKWFKKGRLCVLLTLVCMMLFGVSAMASEDDNSLSSLGILTEGAIVSPEFAYNIWSYEVTVPGGTKELSLDPVPSSGLASISSINGTTLNEDGTGYVTITVQAGNGSQFTYELNVVSDGTVPVAETETETETEPETETETEPETEDSQYVKVDKNSLQEAENTITNLKGQITEYKEKVSLFTKIMYGLIGLAIILLFVVINLLLKKKDLKAELNDYRSYGYTDNEKAQKAQQKADKKQEKLDKKQEKAEKKQQKKKKGAAQEEDMDYSYQQSQPSVKPASMQSGYASQDMYAQNGYSGMNAQSQSQQMYQGLDVQPQVSKKAKQMPQYEQPGYQQAKPQQTVPQQPKQAPQPQAVPAQQSGKAAKKGKKSDVEINMIDL